MNSVALHFTDMLDDKLQQADPPRFALYWIELTGADGSVGSSNHASASLAPAASVKGLNFSLDPRGVYLIWEEAVEGDPTGIEFDHCLWRQAKGAGQRVAVPFLRSVLHQDEGGLWTAIDTTIEWEKTYTYWITPVTRVYSVKHELLAQFEGEDSASLTVTAHDAFPPSTPEDFMAVPSEIPTKKFVDLAWKPNVERDLAGYIIYRREDGGAMARIATPPANTLSYQDTDVSAGHKYFYAVSAIDLRGNESGRTAEIAVTQ
ncbi:MAG TPA: fibronectin type III domain-containing protein [Terriglobales bacterium]|nr:fibronectin type III domain-containing protein [Terriglobales bacterium]